MPVKGGYLLIASAGGLLLWSGLTGKAWSTVVRDILAGKNPRATLTAYQIAGTPPGGSGATGSGKGGGGPIPQSHGGALPSAVIQTLWISAGGPVKLARTMSAIAMCESGRRPGAVQQGQPYSTTGWGLWQITPGNSVPQAGIDRQLLNPARNAKAAVIKYREQGLGAWTTYNDGCYLQYM